MWIVISIAGALALISIIFNLGIIFILRIQDSRCAERKKDLNGKIEEWVKENKRLLVERDMQFKGQIEEQSTNLEAQIAKIQESFAPTIKDSEDFKSVFTGLQTLLTTINQQHRVLAEQIETLRPLVTAVNYIPKLDAGMEAPKQEIV
jgi:predicted nuclease with TOPRIM domain